MKYYLSGFYGCVYIKFIIGETKHCMKITFLKAPFMTPKTINHNKIFLFILICLCIFFTMSCAKLIAVKSVEEASLLKDAPLEKIYKKIIIHKFDVDQVF